MPRLPAETVSFCIDGLPPSANHGHKVVCARGRPRMYLTPSLSKWRQLVENSIKRTNIRSSDWYGFECFFSMPIYTKDKKVKRKDLDNMIKHTIDAVMPFVTESSRPVDDSRIIEIEAQKINCEDEKTQITIYAIR